MVERFEKIHSLEISQPISKNIFSVATAMWIAGQEITVKSLGDACSGMKIKATPENIKDMVQLSDLLNKICPA